MNCILNHIKAVVQIVDSISLIIPKMLLEQIYGKLLQHGYNDAWICTINKIDVYNFISSYGYVTMRFFLNSSSERYEICLCKNGKLKLIISDKNDNIIGYEFNYDNIV